MLLLRGLLLVAVLGLWIYSVFDVIRSDAEAVRYLHKLIWLVLVIFISPVGPLAWLFLGRPQPVGTRLFEPRAGAQKPPDDSPEFLASLDDEIRRRRRTERMRSPESSPADIEEEIRRLEEELRRRSTDEEGDDQGRPLN